MKISIRKFKNTDIPNKVKWINDPLNNKFLHYDLPLEIIKTEIWFEKNKDRKDRYDAVIEVDGIPVGLIGLLNIDVKNKKAEYYITLGEREYLGKGIAKNASFLILEYAFAELGLNRVYLYTEVDNIPAVKLYERVGFICEGVLKNDLFSKGRCIDRYVFAITKRDFYHKTDTPIQFISHINNNRLFIKREDLIPYSFGGNKARKSELFFEEIVRGNYDCVVTYGSSSSNHCRVISNMAASRNMPCYIISPEEAFEKTYNSQMMDMFGAEFTVCPVDKVHDTIDNKLDSLRKNGFNPYFIPGGGHGNIGTQAYVECYEEICRFEKQNNVCFDYIFHASGTGTTQAGLVCGQIINCDTRNIVGISIARNNPRGREVVVDSIKEYTRCYGIDVADDAIEKNTVFIDDYICSGYGKCTSNVEAVIELFMKNYGVPFDHTYTGKAFVGMLDYIERMRIEDKNVLFIHTGGTPLFFDHINKKCGEG